MAGVPTEALNGGCAAGVGAALDKGAQALQGKFVSCSLQQGPIVTAGQPQVAGG